MNTIYTQTIHMLWPPSEKHIMRLLSTQGEVPKLRSFISENSRPPYAILSHTWMADEDEVQFSDMSRLEQAKQKPGWTKIMQSRKQAEKRGFEWIWIDTCCIDKSSSAELSEAINSMFRWYREAKECYVSLVDDRLDGCKQDHQEDRSEAIHEGLKQCRWFGRGWTLQEMVAPDPQNVHFFDQNWENIGTLKDIADVISRITGISRLLFTPSQEKDRRPLGTYTIAQRMSWAADRVTTRVEDEAYSLLGIFGVNIPTVYGEGQKAFLRLQEAIMRDQPHDPSIFGWDCELSALDWDTSFEIKYPNRRNLLAPSVQAFRRCQNMDLLPTRLFEPFEITNTGVLIEVLLVSANNQPRRALAILPCPMAQQRTKFLALVLSPSSSNQYFINQARVIETYDTRAPRTLAQKRIKIAYDTISSADTSIRFAAFQPKNSDKYYLKFLIRFTPRSKPFLIEAILEHTIFDSKEGVGFMSSYKRFPTPDAAKTLFTTVFRLRPGSSKGGLKSSAIIHIAVVTHRMAFRKEPGRGTPHKGAIRLWVPVSRTSEIEESSSRTERLEKKDFEDCVNSAVSTKCNLIDTWKGDFVIEAQMQFVKLAYEEIFLIEIDAISRSPGLMARLRGENKNHK